MLLLFIELFIYFLAHIISISYIQIRGHGYVSRSDIAATLFQQHDDAVIYQRYCD